MLNIIAGRTKSGKSELAVRRFAEYINSDAKTDNAYYIVPEQFTLDVENRILASDAMKTPALFGDEVLSFRRLVHRILGKFGGASGDVLSESGKIMLLTKVANSLRKELLYYKDIGSNPFRAEQILGQIEEFGKNLVKKDSLESAAENADSEALKMKLKDLALIYGNYNEVMSEIGATEESLYIEAAERAKKNRFFENKKIWIDEFTGFTPIERKLIECMISSGADVTVVLCFDRENDPIFDCIRNTKDSLVKLCDEYSVKYNIRFAEELWGENGGYSYRTKLLGDVEKYFTAVGSNSEKSLTRSEALNVLEIHESNNIISEIQSAACKVRELYGKGVDYSDIALACRNIDEYGPLTEAVFSGENIPFFRDSRKNILTHPVVSAVYFAFSVITDNFRQKDIISFLKTGLYIMDPSVCDTLDNFIHSSRLNGQSRWSKTTEPSCAAIYTLFSEFRDNIKKKKTISGVVEALRIFIVNSGIEKNVSETVSSLIKQNLSDEAEEYRLVWNSLTDILNQAEAFLGEWESDSFSEICTMFSDIFSSALSKCSIGILPVKNNAVRLLDISRSCMKPVKALIVLGANEGVMPASVSDGGLLNDSDRAFIKTYNIELADDTDTVIEKEMFRVYSALFTPSDYLYISYPLIDSSAEAMIASGFVVNKISGLFADMVISHDSDIGTVQAQTVKDAFVSPDNADKRFFSKENACMSVSQIEQYTNCPFSYFVKYGLRAQERDDGEWDGLVIGNIMHSIVEEGLREAEKRDFTANTDEEIEIKCRDISDTILQKKLDTLPGGYSDEEKRSVLALRLSRFAGYCIYSIHKQLSESRFTPKAYELQFGHSHEIPSVDFVISGPKGDENRTVHLEGKIDRVDIMKDDETKKAYVRVIDYKSGSKTVTLDEINSGLQLQLAVYLDALTNGDERRKITGSISDADTYDVIPAGLFYYTFDDDINKLERNEMVKKLDDKNIMMNGLIADIPTVEEASKNDSKFGKSRLPDSTLMFSSVENIISDKIKCIMSGRFPSDALVTDPQKSPCLYCKYGSICGRKGNQDGKL